MTTVTTARGARAVRVAAQAKVNLRLRVLARETSGYHQLETLFLRLSLADDVYVRVTGGERTLDIGGDFDARQLGPTERNLAWRAAEAYVDATGWPSGFAIQLDKHIPVGGGLGGGSADAGAVLRALDAISSTPIGEEALLAIAARLGADVPFLTTEHPFALAWGRGERLLVLPAPPEREVLLLLPAFGVNTAHAYGWLADAREIGTAPSMTAARFDPSSLSQWESLTTHATNDFEAVIAARHPQITALVDALRAAGCAIAMMSGSGSTVFGVLPAEGALEMPRFAAGGSTPAPHVLLTRTATHVEPIVVTE
ncbi:MAG: 4-(cytidine 5'-diphospho)-2-C-methyl-D-erythritol kinase [Gemmatimonadaceae bacterium]